MQHPVGYTIRNGRAELTDFFAVIFNYHGILEILHVIPAGLLLAVLFYHGHFSLSPAPKTACRFVITRSFKTGLTVGLL